MRLRTFAAVTSALLIAAAVPAFAGPKVRRGPTSPHVIKTRVVAPRPHVAAVRSIAPERSTQIQTALIKAGYLNGTPSGTWDTQTEAAMLKLQSDNH